MLKVTIRQIESFLAVADNGNFSRASRRLNIAQPALSQAVKDLEAELGVRLFDRTTRRVELTDAGREFAGSAAAILEDLQLAVQNARDLAQRKRGRIRIAAPPLLAAVVLPQAISAFKAQHPGISVELVDVGTEQILQSVISGRAECGLGTFSAGSEGIERVLLMRDNLMLFCAADSALDRSGPIRWKDLETEPIIALTRDSGIRLLVEVGFEAAQIPVKPAYEVSHVTTALALVEAGLGVSVLPTYAKAAALHKRIVGRQLCEPTISRDIVLIHASGRAISPAVTAFTTILRRFAHTLAP